MICSEKNRRNLAGMLEHAWANESAATGQPAGATPEFRKTASAQQDFAAGEAAYKLGNMGEAAAWYRQAAEKGDIPAQFSMGVMYDTGQGVAQNYQQAILWYGKAAEHGNVKAQNNLGFMYSRGKGVAQNYTTAHMWFNISGCADMRMEEKTAILLKNSCPPPISPQRNNKRMSGSRLTVMNVAAHGQNAILR